MNFVTVVIELFDNERERGKKGLWNHKTLQRYPQRQFTSHALPLRRCQRSCHIQISRWHTADFYFSKCSIHSLHMMENRHASAGLCRSNWPEQSILQRLPDGTSASEVLVNCRTVWQKLKLLSLTSAVLHNNPKCCREWGSDRRQIITVTAQHKCNLKLNSHFNVALNGSP